MNIKINRTLPVFLLLLPLLFWSCSNDSSSGSDSSNSNSTNNSSTTTETPATTTTIDTNKIAAQIAGNTYDITKFITIYKTKRDESGIEYDTTEWSINNNIITMKYLRNGSNVLTYEVTVNTDSTCFFKKNSETPVTITDLTAETHEAHKTKDLLQFSKMTFKFNSDKTGEANGDPLTWTVNSDGTVQYTITPKSETEPYTTNKIHSDDSYNTWYLDSSVDTVFHSHKEDGVEKSSKIWVRKKS